MKYKVIVVTNDKRFDISDFDNMFDANDRCDLYTKTILASKNAYNVVCVTMYEVAFGEVEIMRAVYFNN